MTRDITVPVLGESISEATVVTWLKSVGEAVEPDEPLIELETDKVTMEVNSPVAGVLTEIAAANGAEVEVGALLGRIDPDATRYTEAPASAAEVSAAAPRAPVATSAGASAPMSPAVRKLVDEGGLDPSVIPATGRDGRLTKGDVLTFLKVGGAAAPLAPISSRPAGSREERVKMSRLRQRIAERLKSAQNTAAILTTFNEVDMSAIITLRNKYRESFEKAHGVRLGFMSPFVKACTVALREFPAVNAELEGDHIVYKNHYDIGIAVGTKQGLVVPVLYDADQMGFADIEKAIGDFGRRAREGKLTMKEMAGATFTITNGGIYGSMLSTPILNAPQSGILGMHNIVERPWVVDGEVKVRPIMYVALSYDHRIIDGREAVSFLVRVKQCIEDPERIMLDL